MYNILIYYYIVHRIQAHLRLMPHLSKRQLDDKTKHQILETLDLVLGKLKKDEMRMFLFSLLSRTEKLMVAKRLAVIILLQQGVEDSAIAETLKITRSTVNKLEMVMKIKDEGFALALKKIEEDKLAKEFKNILVRLAKYSVRAAGGHVKPEIF